MAIINIRNLDEGSAQRIRKAAQARGWSGKYFSTLVDFHEALRQAADKGGEDTTIAKLLATYDLETKRG